MNDFKPSYYPCPWKVIVVKHEEKEFTPKYKINPSQCKFEYDRKLKFKPKYNSF